MLGPSSEDIIHNITHGEVETVYMNLKLRGVQKSIAKMFYNITPPPINTLRGLPNILIALAYVWYRAILTNSVSHGGILVYKIIFKSKSGLSHRQKGKSGKIYTNNYGIPLTKNTQQNLESTAKKKEKAT